MNQALVDARMAIASDIGSDVGSFTPPEEKRFAGVEIMLGIAGAMLYAFFAGLAKGMAGKLGETVGEKISRPLAKFVGEKIDELMGKDRATQDRLLDNSHSEARKQIESAGLTATQLSHLAQAIESELVVSLSEKAPDDVSIRIARTVRSLALKTL